MEDEIIDCRVCKRFEAIKRAGVGLCGECPYNFTFVPHFEPAPQVTAYKELQKK